MTVVAAATTSDGVVMAADAQIQVGNQKLYDVAPKLWTAQNLALGASGCLRTAQVLKHHIDWPRYRPDEDTDFEAWVIKTVVPMIRSGTDDKGVVKNNNGIERINVSILLTTKERIAEISGNGCVTVELCGRAAIGAGYAEALGYLGDSGPWTEADVIEAVRRATISNLGCSGPIAVVNTQDLTIRTIGPADA